MDEERSGKWWRALRSVLDPRSYAHVLRLIHFYHYSHVDERRKVQMGAGTVVSPNVSFRNASLIRMGRNCHIGERSYLWAGDETGRILIGDYVSLAPEVFITASDYRFRKGIPFQQQHKRERDVTIGHDVWLGARVMVTAGVTIGEGCIVGAGAVVTRDLPANSIAVGVPARPVATRPDGDAAA